MCGRYTLTRQEKLEEAFEASIEGVLDRTAAPGGAASPQRSPGLDPTWWKPRFNIAPTQPAPVIAMRDGKRQLALWKWGLVPHWATKETKSRPPLLINARVETLTEKPAFRDALARRRCLVPADGFFEWQREGRTTPLPLYFHPGETRTIAFAGLWARARTDAGEVLSFTIITGPPNDLVAPVHDRMPMVLDPAAYAAWLDPATAADAARALLATPPVGDWRADPVSTYVNKVDHDDPACIALAPPDLPKQTSLF